MASSTAIASYEVDCEGSNINGESISGTCTDGEFEPDSGTTYGGECEFGGSFKVYWDADYDYDYSYAEDEHFSGECEGE